MHRRSRIPRGRTSRRTLPPLFSRTRIPVLRRTYRLRSCRKRGQCRRGDGGEHLSTPVTPRIFTRASIRTRSRCRAQRSTVILPRGSGWQENNFRGALAPAEIPTTRATGRASPLGEVSVKNHGNHVFRGCARSPRQGGSGGDRLSVASTMCAEPSASWVSSWLGCEVEVIVSLASARYSSAANR